MQPGFKTKMCKFGPECYKYQQGTCTFYHPQQGGGGRGRGIQPQIPNIQDFKGKKLDHTKIQNKIDPILNQFCRYYQIAQCTKSQCKKKHNFTKNNSLHRVLFTRQMPNHQTANLGTFTNNGKNFLSLRLGNNVYFYEFNSQTNALASLDSVTWSFPEVKQGYNYYQSKQNYLYFAFTNENTLFTNIGYYNVFNKQLILIENAHQKEITGISHFNDSYLMSSSTDGTIKFWKKQENNSFILDKMATQNINSSFNFHNDLKIMFMDFKNFGEFTLLTAGTSDNRLLLWFGQNMDFRQIIFQQRYNKVVRITYIQHQSEWLAIVLLWGGMSNQRCALVAINILSLNCQVIIHKDIQTSQQLMCEIVSIGNLLLVSDLSGIVNIYKIPQFNEKIGVIMHQNSLCNIKTLFSVTSTNIPIKNLIILEKKTQKKEGSFSVYTFTQ